MRRTTSRVKRDSRIFRGHFLHRPVLNKILAAAFIFLILGKMFFRPQLSAVKKWFDGVVNAMLVAIFIAYGIQLVLWLTSGAGPR